MHQAYGVPLTMHITPTLASAIQWAAIRPVRRPRPTATARRSTRASPRWRATGIVDLLGSTFSDHILPYFDAALNQDNVSLANEFLTNIYRHRAVVDRCSGPRSG